MMICWFIFKKLTVDACNRWIPCTTQVVFKMRILMPSATGIWENLLFCMARWVGKHRHPMEEKISMAKEKQHFNTFHACNLEWIWNIIFTYLLMVVFLWLCQSGSAWDRRHRQPHNTPGPQN
jgi:hypothetical protein